MVKQAIETLSDAQQEVFRESIGVGERDQANGFVGLNDDGEIEATVLVRQGTSAELDALVLGDGEIAVVLSGGNPVGLRVGDGVTSGGNTISLTQVSGYLSFYDSADDLFVDTFSVADGSLTVGEDIADLDANAIAATFNAVTTNSLILKSSTLSLTASVNDVVLSTSRVSISSNGAYNITGFNATGLNGLVFIHNNSAFTITLQHLSGSSIESNQISSTTGANISLTAGRVAQMIYVSGKWRAWLC